MKFKDAFRTLRFKEKETSGCPQLYTKWGEYLEPNNVLMEYPRPQLRRKDYTILNGFWKYCITKEKEWPSTLEDEILVPFSPESVLSGVSKQLKPDEFLWYERMIPMEKKLAGHRCLLHFGAVDQFCEVFVNKTKVKQHMGGYLPFTADITDELTCGDNILTVKVTDTTDTSYHTRGKQKLDRGGMFYTAQSGIWQTVWMEWVPDRYIEKLRITPMVDQNAIYLEIIMNDQKQEETWGKAADDQSCHEDSCVGAMELKWKVRTIDTDGQKEGEKGADGEALKDCGPVCKDRKIIYTDAPDWYPEMDSEESHGEESHDEESLDGESHGGEFHDGKLLDGEPMDSSDGKGCYGVTVCAEHKTILSVSNKLPVMKIAIPDIHYWSPEDPFLYDLVITVGNDRVESYFAMRKIEVKKDPQGIRRIYLNNELYFQNGLLDQGYWPDGLYTAPCDEALIFDIQTAKRLGFRMIRKHLKIEPLRWYYHCDRLGMLVWQDMVNGGGEYNKCLVGYLPTFLPKLTTCCKDKHYRMLGRRDEEGRKEWLTECKEMVEHLYNCPSIVTWVPFNEGWGQFDSKHVYQMIRSVDKTRLIDHASGWFDQKAGDFKSIHNYFHKLKVKSGKRPVVLSEYGGYACYVSEHSYCWQMYGYRIYLSSEDFNKDFQRLMTAELEELKKKGLAAAVYTQLSDIEDEVNGLLTYDRKVCKVKPIGKGES